MITTSGFGAWRAGTDEGRRTSADLRGAAAGIDFDAAGRIASVRITTLLRGERSARACVRRVHARAGGVQESLPS